MANRVAQEAFNHLIGDLRATHGDNLASVVLYGSAASGDFVQLESDYNLLIALERITPEDLRLAQAPMREWQRLGHPLPVYFTSEELRDAADVFPIEFHQMRRARVVLYGRDPFEGLMISDENLRHQTEYELRSKLLQLRHAVRAGALAARRGAARAEARGGARGRRSARARRRGLRARLRAARGRRRRDARRARGGRTLRRLHGAGREGHRGGGRARNLGQRVRFRRV